LWIIEPAFYPFSFNLQNLWLRFDETLSNHEEREGHVKDLDICDSEIPALRIAKFGHLDLSLVRDKNRRNFIFVD